MQVSGYFNLFVFSYLNYVFVSSSSPDQHPEMMVLFVKEKLQKRLKKDQLLFAFLLLFVEARSYDIRKSGMRIFR